MARKQEFGIHEGGLPDPFEESDEIKRTKVKRGVEPGKFLSVENIPNWLNDVGQERDEDDPLVEALNVFRGFPAEIQRDIVRQIEFERQKQQLNYEETLERLKFLVEKNDDILKRGAEIKTPQINYGESAEKLVKNRFQERGEKKEHQTPAMAGISPRDRSVEKTKQDKYGGVRVGSKRNFGRKPKYKDRR